MKLAALATVLVVLVAGCDAAADAEGMKVVDAIRSHFSAKQLRQTCTFDEQQKLTEDLSTECLEAGVAFAGSVSPTGDISIDGEQLGKLCAPDCLGPLNRFYENCLSKDIAGLFVFFCSKNTDGALCGTFLNSDSGFANASGTAIAQCEVLSSILDSNETCGEGCKDALTTIVNDYGCCFNSFVNNPLLSLSDLGRDNSTQWAACELENPKNCDAPELGGSAALQGSVMAAAFMVALSLLLGEY